MVKRGDVYYADLSPVVGSEQGGIRPVLIIQNDIGNRFSPTVIVAAITAKILGDVVSMSKLMGAKVVVTGIQPAVAITLIELGITFSGVLSAMDLESGLEKLKQELGE